MLKTKGKHLAAMKRTGSAQYLLFLGTLVFFFISPFIYIKGLYDYVILPQSAFIQVFSLGLTAAFLLICLVSQNKIHVKTHPLNQAVLFFLVWTFAASGYAHNHFEAFRQWGHWAACGLIFFLMQQLFVSSSRVYAFLSVVYAAGFLTAVIGICQHFFHIDFIPQAVAPAATFANKNMASQFIVLAFPLGVVWFFLTKKQTDKWLAVLGSVLMIAYLACTQTRAAWLAVFFELVLMGTLLPFTLSRLKIRFWNKKKLFFFLVVLAVGLTGAGLGATGLQHQGKKLVDRVVSIFDTSRQIADISRAENPDLRLAIWRNTIEMVKERPFLGYGLGNHKIYYPKYHSQVVRETTFSETHQPSHVHNDFLQLLSETGIVGAMGAGLVFFLFFVMAAKLWLRAPGRVVFAALGIGTAVAGILVNSCFSFPFDMPIPPLIVAGYLACVPGLATLPENRHIHVSGKWTLLMTVVFLLFACGILTCYHYRDIQSDRHHFQTRALEKAKNWPGVIFHANKALAYNPLRKKILSYSARGYIETGNFNQGVDALEKVIQAYPYHMGALLNLGVAWTGLDELDKALACYQKVLDIKPDFSKAHANMGSIYMGRKQYKDAVNSFEKALVNDPKNAMVLYHLGMCHYYLNGYKAAAHSLKKTVALKPDMVKAQLNLAIIYYQHLKKPEKSIPHFKKVLALEPDVANNQEIKKIIQMIDARKTDE
jgi:O-antigen ligase/Tfp pilus assembly protein PilF